MNRQESFLGRRNVSQNLVRMLQDTTIGIVSTAVERARTLIARRLWKPWTGRRTTMRRPVAIAGTEDRFLIVDRSLKLPVQHVVAPGISGSSYW